MRTEDCNPTCAVACNALCWRAVQLAQTRNIPYVDAVEFLIKTQRGAR